MHSDYKIIPAQTEHIPALAKIEMDAAQQFSLDDLPAKLRTQTIASTELNEALRHNLLWVVVSKAGSPVGFAVAKRLEVNLHILEMDVHPEHQRRGIGRTLVQEIISLAYQSGYRAITLTTYRYVSWNAPWYERLGFRALQQEELGSGLQGILREEAERGLNPERRVAMCLELKNVIQRME